MLCLVIVRARFKSNSSLDQLEFGLTESSSRLTNSPQTHLEFNYIIKLSSRLAWLGTVDSQNNTLFICMSQNNIVLTVSNQTPPGLSSTIQHPLSLNLNSPMGSSFWAQSSLSSNQALVTLTQIQLRSRWIMVFTITILHIPMHT